LARGSISFAECSGKYGGYRRNNASYWLHFNQGFTSIGQAKSSKNKINKGRMRYLLVALLSAASHVLTPSSTLAGETPPMLPVAFERADPMWAAARKILSASAACVANQDTACVPKPVGLLLSGLEGAPRSYQLEAVNRWVNSRTYVPDASNWKRYDYWQNIAEFLARGGDCEDYAIAKYSILRALGVPAKDMRLLIVDDRRKREIHAVLAVDTGSGTQLLDNQSAEIVSADDMRHYIVRVAVNETQLWRMADLPLVSAAASRR
jgi:predicted transglutaminase-like cysteine proteinase